MNMSLLSPILRQTTAGLMWWCPGCKHAHHVNVAGSTGPQWTWNGELTTPSFQPSVLVRGIRQDMTDEELAEYDYAAVRQTSAELLASKFGTRCHLYVVDGQIQFLADCTHELAGQTVPIPAWPHTETDQCES